jgi:hypothetical protein
LGEIKVTDSGCSVTELNPAVDRVGDGVTLGATVGVAAVEAVWVTGAVIAALLLHPASRNTARTPTTRLEWVMTGERSFNGLCSGLR